MAQEKHEFIGKSVDDAVAEGLKALQLRPDQVTIEVLSKGSRGIFGLGSEPAHVRLTPLQAAPAPSFAALPATPEPAEVQTAIDNVELAGEEASALVVSTADLEPAEPADVTSTAPPDLEDEALAEDASVMLTKLITLMGFECHVQAIWKAGGDEIDDHDGPYLLLNVKGGDLGALIGRRGETLESLQYLLRLMVNQRVHRWTNIVVDIDGYKERRAAQLNQLALRTAMQVAQSGRSVSLEPMPANERRIIHMVLRDHPEVYTESSGEADRRKVHIIAKD